MSDVAILLIGLLLATVYLLLTADTCRPQPDTCNYVRHTTEHTVRHMSEVTQDTNQCSVFYHSPHSTGQCTCIQDTTIKFETQITSTSYFFAGQNESQIIILQQMNNFHGILRHYCSGHNSV